MVDRSFGVRGWDVAEKREAINAAWAALSSALWFLMLSLIPQFDDEVLRCFLNSLFGQILFLVLIAASKKFIRWFVVQWWNRLCPRWGAKKNKKGMWIFKKKTFFFLNKIVTEKPKKPFKCLSYNLIAIACKKIKNQAWAALLIIDRQTKQPEQPLSTLSSQ